MELHRFLEVITHRSRGGCLDHKGDHLLIWTQEIEDRNYFEIRIQQGKIPGTTGFSLFKGQNWNFPDTGGEKQATDIVKEYFSHEIGNKEIRLKILTGDIIEYTGHLLKQKISQGYDNWERSLKLN